MVAALMDSSAVCEEDLDAFKRLIAERPFDGSPVRVEREQETK